MQTPKRNPNVLQSMVKTIQNGRPTFCVSESNHRMPATESRRPRAPATNASSTLSVSSCRMTCQRLAPIATRTLISPVRRAARASRRLATLEQAISSTKPTAPNSDQNSSRICGPTTRP